MSFAQDGAAVAHARVDTTKVDHEVLACDGVQRHGFHAVMADDVPSTTFRYETSQCHAAQEHLAPGHGRIKAIYARGPPCVYSYDSRVRYDEQSWSFASSSVGREVVHPEFLDDALRLSDSSTPFWKFGAHKKLKKIQAQMAQRGWTPAQISEAIKDGVQYPAVNNINKGNKAIRYVHPETGRSVVVDTVTKEVLHVGGDGFLY